MSLNSTDGTVKPSVVNIENDVEIWYNYRRSRSDNDIANATFKRGDVSVMFSKSFVQDTELTDIDDKTLIGMYNLTLPVSMFSNKGIYTIYIKPKEYFFTIKDVGVLSAYPDTSGIVIDLSGLPNQSFFGNGNLVGYRIEYFEYKNNGLERQEYYRLVTSNNKCEPVSQNLTSSMSSSNGYRFNDSGTLCFLTLTPSTSPGFKANEKPYIGSPNQKISITNTKFDPIMIEVEVVEHDIETLSVMAEGEMLRNLENGRVSYYNFDGEIYKQFEFSTVKDNYTTKSVAELKVNKDGNIDTSLDINELKDA
jgi:hypothetical protein